ncbi:MAG: FeoA family protein [Moorellales bacterium]
MRGCGQGWSRGSGGPGFGCRQWGGPGLRLRGWRWRWGRRVGKRAGEEGGRVPVAGQAGVPLVSLVEGTGGRVIGLDTGDPLRLQRLLALGLVPGVWVEVVQRFPCYVVQVGLTQVALDLDTARGVYVAPEPLPAEPSPPPAQP